VSGLARADGLAIIPEDVDVVEEGSWIDVMLLGYLAGDAIGTAG
jgi:molybdopterin biosynthesis enzyme